MISNLDYVNDLNGLRSLLERGPAVIYHCPEYWDYGISYVSPNVADLLGWAPDDFTENPIFRQEIIHPDDLPLILNAIPALFSEGRQTHEYRLRKKNGDYIWVADEIQSLQGRDGELEGIVGYLTDITNQKATERSLRESELRHRTIFETILEGIVTIDTKGIVQDVNKAVEDIFGYKAEEIIGQNVSMLMPHHHAQQHDDYLERYLQTAEARVVGIGREVQGQKKNGELFDMALAVSELKLPTGMYFVGSIRDISERVKAEQDLRISQERLRTSQNFAKIGTFDWHIADDQVFWSEQVGPLFGLFDRTIQMSYDKYIECMHPKDREVTKLALKACIKEGREYNIGHRVIWPNGTIRWLHQQGDVIRNEKGHAIRLVGIIQDVTDAKKREVELETAKEIADGANKAKSEFLSRMSHELRTPLNAILGFAQLLGISRKHPLAERQQKQVGQIVTAGKHLLELINEVLDLARIEAGHLNLSIEPVQMAPVLEECMALAQTLAADSHISVSCSQVLDEAVLVDRMRMKQVLINLLSNAIKYNNENGNVELKVEKLNEYTVRFSVIDDGHGISDEQKEFLFQPFSRLGAEQGNIEGTGIGLTLTKQLVEAMNGEIDFESTSGKGTTFWVNVPIAYKEPEEGVAEVLLSLPHAKTLLYVDDNEQNRAVMQKAVGLVDKLNLQMTDNMESAFALVQKQSPDMIILDINMAGINGIDAVKVFRHIPETENMPIYALSANSEQKMIDKALAAGFDNYFIKPINVRKFTKTLMTVWAGGEK